MGGPLQREGTVLPSRGFSRHRRENSLVAAIVKLDLKGYKMRVVVVVGGNELR